MGKVEFFDKGRIAIVSLNLGESSTQKYHDEALRAYGVMVKPEFILMENDESENMKSQTRDLKDNRNVI
jgi:hypothetical protein